MLTLSKISAARASHYYTVELPGQSRVDSDWVGNGATETGLSGEVEKEDFVSIINGRTPSGEPLYAKEQPKRVAGYDVTISAPKSVSIVIVWGKNQDVLQAHKSAARETFRDIEREAETRVYKNGQVAFEKTGVLVGGEFLHTLSRANEPQVHTHFAIANATLHDGKWRSFYARKLFKKIKHWGAVYRSRLADGLIKLGHTLRKAGETMWELASVPKQLINQLSTRRAQILERTPKNATTPQKQAACFATRPKKNPQPVEKLRTTWKQTLKEKLDRVISQKTQVDPSEFDRE